MHDTPLPPSFTNNLYSHPKMPDLIALLEESAYNTHEGFCTGVAVQSQETLNTERMHVAQDAACRLSCDSGNHAHERWDDGAWQTKRQSGPEKVFW